MLPAGPRPQAAALAQQLELGRLEHAVRNPENQHAPPLAAFQVEMVGLEGDRPVAVR
jgi:hypothetical protein